MAEAKVSSKASGAHVGTLSQLVFPCRGVKVPVPLMVHQGDTQVGAVKALHTEGPHAGQPSSASSILQNLQPVPRRALSAPSPLLIPAHCLPFLTWGSFTAGKRCPIAVLLVTHLKPNCCFSFHPFICLSFSCSNGVTGIRTKLCESLPVCCRFETKTAL